MRARQVPLLSRMTGGMGRPTEDMGRLSAGGLRSRLGAAVVRHLAPAARPQNASRTVRGAGVKSSDGISHAAGVEVAYAPAA